MTAVLLVMALAGALAAPEQRVTRVADGTSPSTTVRARPSTTTTVRVTTTVPTTTTTAPPPPPAVVITVPPTEPPPPEPEPVPEPIPPPEEPPGGGCHPSYDPCVPIASDVDCLGGSGDGPEYTGMVSVIGPDVYDLDRDDDGIGCES